MKKYTKVTESTFLNFSVIPSVAKYLVYIEEFLTVEIPRYARNDTLNSFLFSV